ncbi:hypothetical protein AB0K18_43080 [Nonomuraea sp. NPDC049421]|uniref:hypothetical protein n=1 Tax=Nonomuraea sp. NPDC049421 TaxID=3155275 RepID=UPI003425B961
MTKPAEQPSANPATMPDEVIDANRQQYVACMGRAAEHDRQAHEAVKRLNVKMAESARVREALAKIESDIAATEDYRRDQAEAARQQRDLAAGYGRVVTTFGGELPPTPIATGDPLDPNTPIPSTLHGQRPTLVPVSNAG